MMRIAITGATGFIGSRLLQHLGPANTLFPLLRNPGSRGPKYDLSQPSALRTALENLDVDLIVHAGAIARRRQCENMAALAHTVNVEATHVIANWAAAHGVRMVFLSSVGVNESNVYAETKHLAERHVEKIGRYGSTLRLAYTFGRSCSASRPRPQKRIEKEAWNPGSQEFDASWRFQPTSLNHLCKIIDAYAVQNDVLPRRCSIVTQDRTTLHGLASAVFDHHLRSCRTLAGRTEQFIEAGELTRTEVPAYSIQELSDELRGVVSRIHPNRSVCGQGKL